jgi:tRNA dimethylallyltransferase
MPLADYPVIAIQGPTGSGKSSLGMELAARFQGEIITCDAFQVYRHMDVGTAKASQADRNAIPHHLLDLFDPPHDFSAGEYQRLAREALSAIRGRERLPLVVGGNGFYLRALIWGLFEGPGRSEELRNRMRKIVGRRGSRSLHRILIHVDPEAATRIAEADVARIIRALEVYFHTGKTMSWWQGRPRETLRGFRWLKLGIAWPREVLYRRIEARVDEMLQAGFLEEVQRLIRIFPPDCQAFKAIGYKEISRYWSGQRSLPDALADMKRESRRYAKRQLTWFRADPEIIWLEGTDWSSLLREAEHLVENFVTPTPGLSGC